ncbi:hypothetical protein B0H63DRAFT_520173 [Podospora didyma]|uniref:Uncharacterized protein n=1 Tax=Podospora didyma TaxID=330526 RepID=A0AAE0P0A3_9PEZI|nr:hypothetical protein B0H63DRAFT_520173 [Podospora didyma]
MEAATVARRESATETVRSHRSPSVSSSSSSSEEDGHGRHTHRTRSSKPHRGQSTASRRCTQPEEDNAVVHTRDRSRSADTGSSHQVALEPRSASRHRPSTRPSGASREPSYSHPAVYGQDRKDRERERQRDRDAARERELFRKYYPPSASRTPGGSHRVGKRERVSRRSSHHHRPQPSRRRDHSSSSSSDDSTPPSSPGEHERKGHEIWMGAARVAMEAGAMAALKMRDDDSPWIGTKGAKVVAAALGAAGVETFMEQRHPDRKGGIRHTVMRQATPMLLSLALRPAANATGKKMKNKSFRTHMKNKR